MVSNPLLENVIIEIEEKIICSLNKDGELDKFEVKGIIYLTLNDPKKNDQGFPIHTRLDAVRYNYRSKDESDLPFTVNVFNSKK